MGASNMDYKFDRRDFIKRAALMPLVAAGIGMGGVEALGAGEGMRVVGIANWKFSCSAYCFAKLLNVQLKGRGRRFILLVLTEFSAKQNFDGFDPTGYYFRGYRERKVPDDKFVFEV